VKLKYVVVDKISVKRVANKGECDVGTCRRRRKDTMMYVVVLLSRCLALQGIVLYCRMLE
jgi:hypothetical protein